jgi:hypothetical protein
MLKRRRGLCRSPVGLISILVVGITRWIHL